MVTIRHPPTGVVSLGHFDNHTCWQVQAILLNSQFYALAMSFWIMNKFLVLKI